MRSQNWLKLWRQHSWANTSAITLDFGSYSPLTVDEKKRQGNIETWICHSVRTIQIEHFLIRRICDSDLEAEELWGCLSSSIWFYLLQCLSWIVLVHLLDTFFFWLLTPHEVFNISWTSSFKPSQCKPISRVVLFERGGHSATLSQMDWPGQCITISKYNRCCKIWPNISKYEKHVKQPWSK